MINEKQARKFCKEEISRIKNYDLAIADITQVWDCHHMTETWWNCTKKELIENECYYNRKACELIFLTHAEHARLHKKGENNPMYGRTGENHPNFGKHHTAESRKKMSAAQKGNTNNKGKTNSIFGKAFKEHYGITRCDNVKLYRKEYSFYVRHNCKFSWEIN